VPDKLSEVYREVSPYSYALGNPVKFIDKDGNFIVDKNGRIIASPIMQNGNLKIAELNGAQYAAFTIKTNKGTEIEAWRIIGQGDYKRTPEQGYNFDMSSNCYGFVLTDGQFYLPIYETTSSQKAGNELLEQILREEGIMVNYNGDGNVQMAKGNIFADGFLMTTKGRKKDAMHIFKKKNSVWEADHGYYGVYSGWDFNRAATKDGNYLNQFSFWSYQDNREQKQYKGISIDLTPLKGLTKDDFLTKVIEAVNKILQ